MRRILLVLSVAALVAVAMSVSAPMAFAKPNPDKEACKEGGFADFAFKNQGQCVSAVNQGFDPTPPPPPPEEECLPPFFINEQTGECFLAL